MPINVILSKTMKAGPVVAANGVTLGVVVSYPQGFRFLPHTDAHKPSRKAHATAWDAVPQWARRAALKVSA